MVLDGLCVVSPSARDTVQARSHLADGRCVGWRVPTRDLCVALVIDAELADRSPPPALVRRFGEHEFWPRWTRAECAAKVARTPIAIWLRDHGLDPVPIPVRTIRATIGSADLVVSAAYA